MLDPHWLAWPMNAVALGGMMTARNHHDDKQDSVWERPIALGHLVLAILGFVVTLAGFGWTVSTRITDERVASERRITEVAERQSFVINVQFPQMRQEVADLHRVDRDRDSQMATMQREIEEIKLNQIKHERDVAAKFQQRKP